MDGTKLIRAFVVNGRSFNPPITIVMNLLMLSRGVKIQKALNTPEILLLMLQQQKEIIIKTNKEIWRRHK